MLIALRVKIQEIEIIRSQDSKVVNYKTMSKVQRLNVSGLEGLITPMIA